MRVLIAPDSFKGSASAAAAANALASGWLAVRPGDQVTRLPLADGGEGTLDVLAATVPGARWRRARVTGPGGAAVTARWLELPGRTAVTELARSSGLPLLARPDPMGAQTTGLGQVLGRALDGGADRMLVGLGGSAATDGGAGALAALGARFLDAAGQPQSPRQHKPVPHVFTRRTVIARTECVAHVAHAIHIIKQLPDRSPPCRGFGQRVVRGKVEVAGEAMLHLERDAVVARAVVGAEKRDAGRRGRQRKTAHVFITPVLMHALLVFVMNV